MDEERTAVLYAVSAICDEAATKECVEVEAGTKARARPNASKETLQLLTDVVLKQVDLLAVDLAHFAQHAGRKKISAEDVILCARRQPEIAKTLSELHRATFLGQGRKRKTRE
ncbi:hypothetical protein ACHHYP_14562 [Achlya hypogyna]|uniref:Centromere protein S n=1 Tax=Achlya hypogyna TaxID=1202772 RepID=A0A1V9YCX8_ACHHY|nr:hypothetical protein ACHHYP_14562 [Achlya hypogyna]